MLKLLHFFKDFNPQPHTLGFTKQSERAASASDVSRFAATAGVVEI